MALTSLLDTALDRALIGYGSVGYAARRRSWRDGDPGPGALAGKVAVVTGARAGLGLATTAGLARLGARVHMVVRGREQGEEAREGLLGDVPGAELVVDVCDVSSLRSVRAYAAAFEGPLHVLVHNASRGSAGSRARSCARPSRAPTRSSGSRRPTRPAAAPGASGTTARRARSTTSRARRRTPPPGGGCGTRASGSPGGRERR